MELLHVLLAASCILLVSFSQSSSLCQGKTLPYMTPDVTKISGRSFDYIIVGGGTAGCPLAATLSKRYSVLVVERGSSPYENPSVLQKKFYGFPLLQTNEFSSISQSFISKDGVSNLRGRVLGGSSTIGGGFYGRASDAFVRRAGWDEELVKESYKWVESKLVSKPELTKWQSVVKFGLLEAGILPYNGFSLEHVEGTKMGGTLFDHDGRRRISADLLGTGNPDNIVVLLNATVKNIIFHKKGTENEKNSSRSIRKSSDPIVEWHRTKKTSEELWHPTCVGLSRDWTRDDRQPVHICFGRVWPRKSTSKGKLELNNTDPRQNPLVEFNYLAKEKDMEECVKMVQLVERVAGSKSIAGFLETESNNNSKSPHELREFCKKNVRTFYHYHGGCAVGSVVDNNYRVHGVKRLRVVDGSSFLESPGTNPTATLMMLGRYQGIKILEENTLHEQSKSNHNQTHV
ncbi:GLUCOSE-METHANOL-CHOLINE (GMC) OXIDOREDUCTASE FAMILY PROTEIN [Salix koriyanagi]|uniref:GLUCOSE-METHANOL-CHOLINE (GMC) OXIDOREDUCTASE FAMILY PROTEIN n=1 Tax=Salix koriyanagi TaxID=2511006 RepID=A0A9Q0WJA1_9ROSI|nr:GLUCOSE-METHANOL-CHOLINE (GMC) OXIDOREDUCTASE FAMILY PROTEIN [Salix koriyanagi]